MRVSNKVAIVLGFIASTSIAQVSTSQYITHACANRYQKISDDAIAAADRLSMAVPVDMDAIRRLQRIHQDALSVEFAVVMYPEMEKSEACTVILNRLEALHWVWRSKGWLPTAEEQEAARRDAIKRNAAEAIERLSH